MNADDVGWFDGQRDGLIQNAHEPQPRASVKMSAAKSSRPTGLRLARMGVVMLPANPGFYHRPQRVEDLVDFVVARVLDHLGVAQELVPRWGE